MWSQSLLCCHFPRIDLSSGRLFCQGNVRLFLVAVFLAHDEQLRNVMQNKICFFYFSMWFSANVFKLSYLRMKILLVYSAGKHLLCLLYATERTWKLWRRILGHSLMPVLALSSWCLAVLQGLSFDFCLKS